MFTLILTIVLASTYATNEGQATAVTSVPGFTTSEQCLIAANAWLDQQRKPSDKDNRFTRAKYTALCAKL